jgi:hypothetical protein
MHQEHDHEYRRRYRLDGEEILYRIRLFALDRVWRIEAQRLDPSDKETVTGEVDAWEFGSDDSAKDFLNAFLDEKHGTAGDEID